MAQRLNEKEKAKILRLRGDGLTYRKIARRVGRGPTIVRLICDPEARAKAREDIRVYTLTHRERARIRANEYRIAHPEETRTRKRKYLIEHREEMKAYLRGYYAEHKEEHDTYNRKWRTEHRQEMAAYSTKYARSDRGRLVAKNHCHKRRGAKQRGSGFEPEDFERLWKEQGGRCTYCGCLMIRFRNIEGTLFQKIAPLTEKRYCNIDHVIPLSKGGLHEISNIVLACRGCNREKGTSVPIKRARRS